MRLEGREGADYGSMTVGRGYNEGTGGALLGAAAKGGGLERQDEAGVSAGVTAQPEGSGEKLGLILSVIERKPLKGVK